MFKQLFYIHIIYNTYILRLPERLPDISIRTCLPKALLGCVDVEACWSQSESGISGEI